MTQSSPRDLSTRISSALCLLALFAAAAISPKAHAAYGPGLNLRSLTHDGELREYDVYAPASHSSVTPTGLLVDLHGASSNKLQQRSLSGWDVKSEEVGILVAYPQGLFNTWNAGVCCGDAAANDVDDVGFIRAMLTAIAAEATLDPTKIYVSGLSNGGAMTQRLACEAADVFVAAAPLAFPTPYVDFATECTPSSTRPLLLFMGLNDVVVPYENGTFGGAVESFDAWRTKNACGPEAPEEFIDFGQSYCDIDTSCGSSTQVGLCSVLANEYPPPGDIFNGHILYQNQSGMFMPDLIWEFFQTGSITQPPFPVPSAGTVAMTTLSLVLAGAGAAGLRRRRRSGTGS